MIIKKTNIKLLFLFFIFLLILFLKNNVFCFDFFNNCLQEPFGGDLKKYSENHYNKKIGNIKGHGLSLFLTFSLTNSWLTFKNYLILFQLVFYSVLFFSGLKLFERISFLKFNCFVLILIFYPIYDGYSTVALKQGLGMIFMLPSIFLVKETFSFKSWLLIIASILSHYVFLLFYFVFYVKNFFQ